MKNPIKGADCKGPQPTPQANECARYNKATHTFLYIVAAVFAGVAFLIAVIVVIVGIVDVANHEPSSLLVGLVVMLLFFGLFGFACFRFAAKHQKFAEQFKAGGGQNSTKLPAVAVMPTGAKEDRNNSVAKAGCGEPDGFAPTQILKIERPNPTPEESTVKLTPAHSKPAASGVFASINQEQSVRGDIPLTTTAQKGVNKDVSGKYFFTLKGVRQGPVTLDELKLLAAREELKRSDYLWTEGMANWQRAGLIAAVFEGLPPDFEPGEHPLSAPNIPPMTTIQAGNVSPLTWYLHGLKNYAVFDGRAQRREFWSFFFVNMGITFLLIIIEVVLGGPGIILNGLYSLAVFIPYLALGIRRMHDTDRSGWWVLLPIGNIIYWAECGKSGSNRFGPDPKTNCQSI